MIGPDFTPGERRRHLATRQTGTVAEVRADRVLIKWDDSTFGGFTPEAALEETEPVFTSAEYGRRHPEETSSDG